MSDFLLKRQESDDVSYILLGDFNIPDTEGEYFNALIENRYITKGGQEKSKENFFIPSSFLSQWRRELTALFLSENARQRPTSVSKSVQPVPADKDAEGVSRPDAVSERERLPEADSAGWGSALTPIAGNCNIANRLSRAFYEQAGVTDPAPAFELQPSSDTPLMTCRHCIRYALGWCYKRQRGNEEKHTRYLAVSQNHPDSQQLYLTLRNGTRLALRFDCCRCLMTVHSTT